jgi:predicted RNase H-like HicB family nuclease
MKAKKRINTYTAILQKTRGGYTSWIEEMPNVISEGKTKAEAEDNLRDALELMLETNRIMAHKDASGDFERVPLLVRQYA